MSNGRAMHTLTYYISFEKAEWFSKEEKLKLLTKLRELVAIHRGTFDLFTCGYGSHLVEKVTIQFSDMRDLVSFFKEADMDGVLLDSMGVTDYEAMMWSYE